MPKIRKSTALPARPVEQFELNLTDDDVWLIGIDQSTSNTGIALMSTNAKFIILLDLHRDKKLEKRVFYRDFYFLLKRIVSGKKIKILVYEKPVPSKYKTAGNVLRELKGHLEEWIEIIPEFEGICVDSLYPQTWKSLIINSTKGKDRFHDKIAVAEDLVDMFPALECYFLTYPYSDYDSFEALGILLGYLSAAFDSNGNQMIFSTMEKTHISFVCYKEVCKRELEDPLFIQNLFGIAYGIFKPVFRSYNMHYNFYKNVRMASSSRVNTYTVIPRTELARFQWEYGIDPEDTEKVMLMFIFRRGDLSKSEGNTLRAIFEWHEDVYGEV